MSEEHAAEESPQPIFDRQLILQQLGGWRGMVDATLPTLAFIVAHAIGGLRAGIWTAVGAAVLVFVLRLARRQSVQQAVSGLFAVGIAVAIAAASGEARNYFAFGIVRNAVVGVVLLGSIPVRWPLVGVIAEFFAPSHAGSLAAHSLPFLRRRAEQAPPSAPAAVAVPEPAPWREDRRVLRAYGWLTALWGGTFLLKVAVQGLFYWHDEVALLGTASLLLGLPVSAVELAITLWVISRLHRYRNPHRLA